MTAVPHGGSVLNAGLLATCSSLCGCCRRYQNTYLCACMKVMQSDNYHIRGFLRWLPRPPYGLGFPSCDGCLSILHLLIPPSPSVAINTAPPSHSKATPPDVALRYIRFLGFMALACDLCLHIIAIAGISPRICPTALLLSVLNPRPDANAACPPLFIALVLPPGQVSRWVSRRYQIVSISPLLMRGLSITPPCCIIASSTHRRCTPNHLYNIFMPGWRCRRPTG